MNELDALVLAAAMGGTAFYLGRLHERKLAKAFIHNLMMKSVQSTTGMMKVFIDYVVKKDPNVNVEELLHEMVAYCNSQGMDIRMVRTSELPNVSTND